VRLEPELLQKFQDRIKQLQQSNNEFKDKNNYIRIAHTLLLSAKGARPAGVPFRCL